MDKRRLALIEELRRQHKQRKRNVVALWARFDAGGKGVARWITTEDKHRVPLDENGIALAGGGGTLKGKDFSGSKSQNGGGNKCVNSGKKSVASATSGAKVNSEKKSATSSKGKEATTSTHKTSASGKGENESDEGKIKITGDAKKDSDTLKKLPKGTKILVKDKYYKHEFVLMDNGLFKDTAWGAEEVLPEKVSSYIKSCLSSEPELFPEVIVSLNGEVIGSANGSKVSATKKSGAKTGVSDEGSESNAGTKLSKFGAKKAAESYTNGTNAKTFHAPTSEEITALESLPAGTILETKNYGNGMTLKYIATGNGTFTNEFVPGYELSVDDVTGNDIDDIRIINKGEYGGEGENDRKTKKSQYYDKVTVFEPDSGAFSDDRRSGALKTYDPQIADDLYRKEVGRIYRALDEETKVSFATYTGDGYKDINAGLRETHGEDIESVGPSVRDDIKRITDTISRCHFKKDTIIPRVVNCKGAELLFGLDIGFFGCATEKQLQALVGKVGTDKGFMSCGSTMGKGAPGEVFFNIYCPKGTVGMYVEPFSVCGNGGGVRWDDHLDGKSKQDTFSDEQETILQRGTTVRITRVRRRSDGSVQIDVDVIKQEVDVLPEYDDDY